MTLIALLGDIHLADRPPSLRTETYTEDILAKLQFAAEEAARRGADALVSVGDVFHLKTPTRNSHHLVQRTGEVLKSTGLPVLIVPGNHDLSNDRLDSLRRQPLGTLAKMAGIDLLMGEHPDLPIFGLPYLWDWSGQLPSWMSRYRSWAQGLDTLMVTHAPIFPTGEVPPYEFIDAADWAEKMQTGDCYYGHIHDPHGSYTVNTSSSAVQMCNNGAVSRGSLHEATLKRKPHMTFWSGQGKFEAVEIPHRPVEAVFRLQEKEDVDERVGRVEQFLSSVGETSLDGLSLEEVAHNARARGFSNRTLSLIEELLQNAL